MQPEELRVAVPTYRLRDWIVCLFRPLTGLFFLCVCDTYQLILRPVAKLACVWLHGPLTVALVLIRLCLTRVSVVVVLLIHRRIQTAYAASNYLFTGGGLCVQYFTVCLTHVVNVSGIVLPWAPRTQKLKSPSAEISGL